MDGFGLVALGREAQVLQRDEGPREILLPERPVGEVPVGVFGHAGDAAGEDCGKAVQTLGGDPACGDVSEAEWKMRKAIGMRISRLLFSSGRFRTRH